MARIAQVLSKAKIAQLKDPGFYAVGGIAGLHLKIGESGSKSWILRVMVAGRRRDLGLGSLADVTVEEAREAARQQRLKIKEGADPVAEKQAARSAAIAARASAITFEDAATKYIAANEAGWKSGKHAAQWGATLALGVARRDLSMATKRAEIEAVEAKVREAEKLMMAGIAQLGVLKREAGYDWRSGIDVYRFGFHADRFARLNVVPPVEGA